MVRCSCYGSRWRRRCAWGRNCPMDVTCRSADPQQVLHQKAGVRGERRVQRLWQSQRRPQKIWIHRRWRKNTWEHHRTFERYKKKKTERIFWALRSLQETTSLSIQDDSLTELLWPFPLEKGFYSGPLVKPFRGDSRNNEVQQSSPSDFLSYRILSTLIGRFKQFVTGLNVMKQCTTHQCSQ